MKRRFKKFLIVAIVIFYFFTKPGYVPGFIEMITEHTGKIDLAYVLDFIGVLEIPTSAENTHLPETITGAYEIWNNNQPEFNKSEITVKAYEKYSDLDRLDRPGVAMACIGKELMPTTERGSIGQIQPIGWHTVKYSNLIDGMYLYNRCHLIGYQLCGTNFLADEADKTKAKNLITGTRYLNVEGMLPFENMVADYVEKTGNHVMYRVTPIYTGNNLVADGVQMEAYSVEDNGKGICFNVFCYNIQPGISINYTNGESWVE